MSFEPAEAPPGGEGEVLDAASRMSISMDVRMLRCCAGRFECWRSAGDGDEWTQIAAVDVAAGYDRFLMYDLDDDAAPSRQQSAAEPPVTGNPGTMRRPNRGQPKERDAMRPISIWWYSALRGYRSWKTGSIRTVTRDHSSHRCSWLRAPDGTETATAIEPPDIGAVHFAMSADLNVDGDLDLLLGTADGFRAWSNLTRLQFQDVTERFEDPQAHGAVVSAAAVDWDRDVDLDILVATEAEGVFLLEDLRHLTFRWRKLEDVDWKGAASIAVLEADGNVSWDIAAAGPNGLSLARTRTPHTGQVLMVSTRNVNDAPRRMSGRGITTTTVTPTCCRGARGALRSPADCRMASLRFRPTCFRPMAEVRRCETAISRTWTATAISMCS